MTNTAHEPPQPYLDYRDGFVYYGHDTTWDGFVHCQDDCLLNDIVQELLDKREINIHAVMQEDELDLPLQKLWYSRYEYQDYETISTALDGVYDVVIEYCINALKSGQGLVVNSVFTKEQCI